MHTNHKVPIYAIGFSCQTWTVCNQIDDIRVGLGKFLQDGGCILWDLGENQALGGLYIQSKLVGFWI